MDGLDQDREQEPSSKRHLLAIHRVMAVLAESKSFESAGPRLLQEIAGALDWQAGLFWKADASGRLRAAALWAEPEMDAAARARSEDMATDAWKKRRPLWSRGPGGAFVFPMVFGDESQGVLEFLARELEEPSPNLLQTMATIGFQVGQFLVRIRTEERLLVERDRLRRLFEQAPAAIAVLRGKDHRYELSNALMDAMSGRPLTGKTIREALPELADSGLAQVVYGVYEKGEPFYGTEIPLSIPGEGGASRDIYINAMYQPLRDDKGVVDGVLCFAYEVTDLVQSRIRAEHAEKSTALIANSVPQIIWMQSVDGGTDFTNDRWFEYTGLGRSEPTQDSWQRVCHPDDAPALLERWAEARARGRAFEAEVRFCRASDQMYRWHLVRSVPLRDDEGRIFRWVGSSTDIHERKMGEEASRFMSEASSILARSLDSETTLTNLASVVVPRMADWCAVYLREPDASEPKLLVIAHADPEKLKWAEEMNRRYPPDPKAPSGAFEVIRTGKSELYSHISEELLALAARDAEHLRILREVGFSSAMTVPLVARGSAFGAISFIAAESRKRYTESDLAFAQELANRAAIAVDNAMLYAEAQKAVRLRDDFLSIASHELKTPLTPIQLHLQSLARQLHEQQPEGLPPEKIERKLDTIARQVRRLDSLISGLLDISRLTGRLNLELEEVDLSGLMRDVVSRFRAEADQTGTPLDLEVPSSLVGDWDRLRVDQIVTNLVANAIKFGAGRPVVVSASPAPGVVRIQVRDSGIGIAPADQERIFRRFERAVPDRHFGGFGLGLWIVRQIVEALGGTIAVESAPQRGATFTVELPRHASGGSPPR